MGSYGFLCCNLQTYQFLNSSYITISRTTTSSLLKYSNLGCSPRINECRMTTDLTEPVALATPFLPAPPHVTWHLYQNVAHHLTPSSISRLQMNSMVYHSVALTPVWFEQIHEQSGSARSCSTIRWSRLLISFMRGSF